MNLVAVYYLTLTFEQEEHLNFIKDSIRRTGLQDLHAKFVRALKPYCLFTLD